MDPSRSQSETFGGNADGGGGQRPARSKTDVMPIRKPHLHPMHGDLDLIPEMHLPEPTHGVDAKTVHRIERVLSETQKSDAPVKSDDSLLQGILLQRKPEQGSAGVA
ncbi:Uncharacterized protein PBTT_07924 [Plasmodiophora brassicae]